MLPENEPVAAFSSPEKLPLVAVMSPLILAPVAESVPSESTENLPLPMFSVPPVMLAFGKYIAFSLKYAAS